MSATLRLRDDLSKGHVVVIDGATGTELERRGAEMHDRAWCAMATVTAPDVLRSIHEDYIRSGARLITANTFSSSRNMLDPAGLGDRFEELNHAALRIAFEARDRCRATDTVVVAGSMSHQVPILGRGDQRNPDTLPPPEIAGERFREMASVLVDAGAELILLEMMSDPVLANLAIDAVRETGLPFWITFSFRAGEDGEPVSYSVPGLSAETVFRDISLHGAEVAGIMHSNVHVTDAAVEQLRAVWDGPMAAYPDSGYFKMPHWQFEDIVPPSVLIEHSRAWWRSGVRVFGGCCGLGVEHVEALVGEWCGQEG